MGHVRFGPLAIVALVVAGLSCAGTGGNHVAEKNQPAIGPKNRLDASSSPYLRQHARNPVDWYPWSAEAFERARSEDKPVLLSIGYSTCHWCHVMARESFEDPEVAHLLNDVFVNIKVDREQRPDIDQVYMTVCQLMTGSGGWPLTVIITPDRKPFFAGTYFPKHSRPGRVGILDLTKRIRDLWNGDRERLLADADHIADILTDASSRKTGSDLDESIFNVAAVHFRTRFDRVNGGFDSAPKFPTPHNFNFLFRHAHRTGTGVSRDMALKTLARLPDTGLFDQIGGGFHRYSTDREWRLPHFEKMLYDQALLVMAYVDAYQVSGDRRMAEAVRRTLGYMDRALGSPDGGFFSAEDADSDGEEGKFYVWTRQEIVHALGREDGEFACEGWAVTEPGNFLDESSGRRTGANVLHPVSGKGAGDGKRLERIRQKLFETREKRVKPMRDEKVLTDWNGLAISAFARASFVFDEPHWLRRAEAATDFVMANRRDEQGRLVHSAADGSAGPVFLEDVAFLVQALLDLYEAGFDPQRLEQAVELTGQIKDLFWDDASKTLYQTASHAEELLVRPRQTFDGALPSGGAVAVSDLVRLARLTGDAEMESFASEIVASASFEIGNAPAGHTRWLTALDLLMGPSQEVVIVGDPGAVDTRAFLDVLRTEFLPRKVVILKPSGPDGEKIASIAPFTADHVPVSGKDTAYVCTGFSCRKPVTDPEDFAALLRE